MDPNVLLFELRSAVEEFTRTHDADDVDEATSRVLHAWSDLDEWIMKGGFLPALWSEAQRRALENTRVPCPPRGDTVDEISGLLESDPWRP